MSEKTEDYEADMNCFFRRVLFVHLYKHGHRAYKAIFPPDKEDKEVKKAQGQQQQQSTIEQDLKISDIPNIKEDEDSEYLSAKFQSYLEQRLGKQGRSEANLTDITVCLFHTFDFHFLFVVFLYVLNTAVRIGATFLFQFLIESLQEENITNAYLYALGTASAYFLDSTVRHNCFYQSPILTGKLKSCVVGCIFKKLLSLTQFTANQGEIGKAINMLSNDFNLIEIKAPFFFGLVTFPLAYAAIIGVLYFRIGVYGLICVGIVILFVPIQILIAQGVGKFIQKVNVHKDKRIKITGEMIDAMKFIKINGWELAFKEIICKIRDKQFKQLIKLAILRSLEATLAKFTIYFGAIVALYVRSQSEGLTQAVIFSTLELMSFMRLYNFFVVMGFGFFFEFRVFLQRFLDLYNQQEVKMICIDENSPQKKNQIAEKKRHIQVVAYSDIVLKTISDCFQVKFKNFNGFWKKEEEPTLKNLNLTIEYGSFYGLYGSVGSGKTSFFQALLKQMPYYTGQFEAKGTISYCEQELIIFSTSIKDNILFGRQFNQERYNRVIQASCLIDDLELFSHRDQTLVGQKGVTLSGGQKARVGLARALYKQANIYLFDDPLSAVDTKVAKHIFDHVFKDFLKGKTVILSTHQVHFLQQCDYLIMMEKGEIKRFVSPKAISLEIIESMIPQRSQSEDELKKQDKPTKKQEFKPEKSEVFTFSLLFKYVFYDSKVLFPIVILLYLISEASMAGIIRVLAYYDLQKAGLTQLPNQEALWALTWGLQGIYFVITFLRYFTLGITLLRANKKIHEDMIHSLVRSHSWYFDITPSGQLSNKFSNDIGVMDQSLIFTLQQAIEGPILILVMVVNIIEMNLYFLIISGVCLIVLIIMFHFIKPLVLHSKQLDLKLKTPVFNKLSQTSNGLIQLRLFSNSKKYLQEINQSITQSYRATIFYWFCTRTMGVSVSYVVVVAMFVSFFIGLELFDNPGLYATAVIYFQIILEFLQWCFRNLANAQSMLISVARAFSLIKIQHEKQLYKKDIDDIFLKQLNPETQENIQKSINQLNVNNYLQGNSQIMFNDFRMRYRKELPQILKGVNLEIVKGQKVGIVGRTGAGKSSIIQSILRICEPEPGSVYSFKGHDALQLGLHTLRHQISVIPQTSFLFRESIRANLDPFFAVDEKQLWQALENSDLKDYIKELPKGLQTQVSNNSDVFSVGQKQLLCLARALIRKNDIVILDEATSHVDKKTDRFIQNILRQKFASKTVITIAHRLLTIADYDKIVVMDDGRVKQVGHPYQLFMKQGSFYEMVKLSNTSADEIVQLAKRSYDKKNI